MGLNVKMSNVAIWIENLSKRYHIGCPSAESIPGGVEGLRTSYVGIPCAVLLADVPGFNVTGVQRRSLRLRSGQAERFGWKIEWLNRGKNPCCK